MAKKTAPAHCRKVLSDLQIQLGIKSADLDEADAMYREAYAELNFWKAQAEHLRAQLIKQLRTQARRNR